MKTLEQLIEEEVAAAVARIVRHAERRAAEVLEAQFGRSVRLAVDDGAVPPEPPAGTRAKRSRPKRRTATEIVELSNRFLQVVRSDPGQPMAVLAPRLGVRPGELAVPVAKLRASKAIKSVGHRHTTKYFPVVAETTAA